MSPVQPATEIDAPSPFSADNANKQPEQAFSSAEAYGSDLMQRIVL
jgi:hypothetical protein